MRINLVVTLLFAVAIASPAFAGDAKGTVAYQGRTVNVKYAYFVQGKYKPTARRLILSTKDLSTIIAKCTSMSCTYIDLMEGTTDGVTIDLEEWPAFAGYVTMINVKQHSSITPTGSLVTKTNDAKKIAGSLKFDESGKGGPTVNVEFDAPLTKEVSAP
jgi:hypothetical protein